MNLTQLAQHLGLSPATVSRVLAEKGGEYRIGEKTQERVRTAAGKLGVTINQQARGLRLRATHTLGLIVPDISNPFFAALCRQVELEARTRGYSVLVADSQEQLSVERELVQLMRSRSVDGLIVAPVTGDGDHLVRLARDLKALVLVDRVAPSLRAQAVVLDNEGAARAGVRLLADAGHRRIACLQGLPASVANSQRVSGYRAALKELGLRAPAAWLAGGDYTVKTGREGTTRMLALRDPPTAILALGNLLALGALEALRAAGKRVPAEVSLVSFDEQPWAASLAPPLTTLDQPVAAMELLFRSLGAKPAAAAAKRVVLPFSVIERKSIGRLA